METREPFKRFRIHVEFYGCKNPVSNGGLSEAVKAVCVKAGLEKSKVGHKQFTNADGAVWFASKPLCLFLQIVGGADDVVGYIHVPVEDEEMWQKARGLLDGLRKLFQPEVDQSNDQFFWRP